LSQAAFHKFEDHLRSQEQKRNRLQDAEAEAGLSPCGIGDPYAPYPSPNIDGEASSPWGAWYGDAFNASNQALPLVSNALPLIVEVIHPTHPLKGKMFAFAIPLVW